MGELRRGIVLGVVLLSLVLGMVGSSQVRAAPYIPPLVVPAPAASAVLSRGADAEWPATLHELDATWEQDWAQTIGVLEHFLDRWPGYGPAEDKLYAALVADAEGHLQADQMDSGVAELERAARRQPGRGEAWARLAQLATAAARRPLATAAADGSPRRPRPPHSSRPSTALRAVLRSATAPPG